MGYAISTIVGWLFVAYLLVIVYQANDEDDE